MATCKCDAPECLYYNGECNAPCLGPQNEALRVQVAALTKERDEAKQLSFENGKALCVMRSILDEVMRATVSCQEYEVGAYLDDENGLRSRVEKAIGRSLNR